MRCFFMRGGHIAAVELLEVNSDQEAVEKCEALFEERKPKYDGLRSGTAPAKSLKVRLAKTTPIRKASEARER